MILNDGAVGSASGDNVVAAAGDNVSGSVGIKEGDPAIDIVDLEFSIGLGVALGGG